jgi:hypothetical protein
LSLTTCQSCKGQKATLELGCTYDFLTRLCDEFEPLHAQLLARHPCVSLMDALAEVRNEVTSFWDAGLLRVSSILIACSSVGRSATPMPLASPPVSSVFATHSSVRVLVFIVIIVVEMDMWMSFATGRKKLRRLRLVILHRVLVVLVLEDLRGVLLVQRHRSFSCYFIVLWDLRRQELLVM